MSDHTEKSSETANSHHSVKLEDGRDTDVEAASRPVSVLIPNMALSEKSGIDSGTHQTIPSQPEQYIVQFDGPTDPSHPLNWSNQKKLWMALMLAYTTLIVTFGSAIFSTATVPVARYFNVSTEVSLLGLAFYVLGFATGPILWAPFSEMKGRRLPLLVSMFGFFIFQFAVATGKDLQTVLLCRFFGGFFGACPLTLVGAYFSDIFDKRIRGLAITIYSATVFIGPLLAPFIGGFIVESQLGWRWTEYITGILGFVAFILDLIFLEESYAPVILMYKAAELRRRTQNWAIHAEIEEQAPPDVRTFVIEHLGLPLRLLVTEPIALFFAIYLAFIYGILYLFLTTYPVVFQEIRGLSPGVGGLPYLGIVCGQLLAVVALFAFQPWYNNKLKANDGVAVPEWRLPPIIVAGAVFAAGLFWFGWSGDSASIHWIVPTLSGLATGFGLLVIFVQSLNYLIDSYMQIAASVIASNTILRSIAGAGFPLFSQYMIRSLGVAWSMSLLGFVAAAMVPVPVLFYVYGHRLRGKSQYAPSA